jgi:hypothetical protein
MAQTCAGVTKAGKPCEITMLADASFCFAHSPDHATERAEARRRGGRNKATARRAERLIPSRLVPTFAKIETALDDVLAGELDPKNATAAAALARALVAVLQAGELEARVRDLEGRGGGHEPARPA